MEVMLEAYSSWASWFRRGLEAGLRVPAPRARRVVFCGMGTSGFAGEYAGFILEELGWNVDWWIRRGFSPGRVGPGDLVVAVSYSGRTAETVECASKAKEAGASVVAVTSGGDLAKAEYAWVPLEPGRPQRTTLAEMVGAVLGTISAGYGVDLAGVPGDIVESLSRDPQVPVGEAVEAIASSDIVIVAGCGYLGLAAHRWRTELAENAKMIAKTEAYPESGHNDLVAYQEDKTVRLSFILLKDPRDPVCSEIMDAVSKIYSEHGRVVWVEPEGSSRPARLLRSAQLAGVASTLAAGRRGVDALATPVLSAYREAVRRIRGLL